LKESAVREVARTSSFDENTQGRVEVSVIPVLTADEIEALIDYLMAKMIGK
jgi:hypothetical protein